MLARTERRRSCARCGRETDGARYCVPCDNLIRSMSRKDREREAARRERMLASLFEKMAERERMNR